MWKEVRRKDRVITQEEVKELLKKGEYGILSTVETDGYPYGVPVNYVYDGEAIYIHHVKETGNLYQNLIANPKVCFTVVGKTQVLPDKFGTKYESVIIFGQAKEVLEKKEEKLEKLLDKYCFAYKEAGMQYINSAADNTSVFRISIEHISGKARR